MMHLVFATQQRGQSSRMIYNSRLLATTIGLADDAQVATNSAKLADEAITQYYERTDSDALDPNAALMLAHQRLCEQNDETAGPALQASSAIVQIGQYHVRAAGWGNCGAYLYRLDCRYLYALTLNDVDRQTPRHVIAQRRPSRKRQSRLVSPPLSPQHVLGATRLREVDARIVTHRFGSGDIIVVLSPSLACRLSSSGLKNTILTAANLEEMADELMSSGSEQDAVIVAKVQA